MDRLGTIYGKPLVKGLEASPDLALKRVKFSVLSRLRTKLVQSAFSDRAKKALAKSLRVEIGESSLTIFSSHPAFIHLMRGQKKGQMTWLARAKAPIPIITESGELIFRTASIKSMKDGKWVHPGREPQDFVEKAKKEAKAQIRKAIVNEVRLMAVSVANEAKRSAKR
jgi:hypothetical protein